MSKTLVQKVVFKNTTAKDLYELYMDAKKHAIATGGPAKIAKKEGTKFSVHGGYVTGKNLHLLKNKLIVQSWRGKDWNKSEMDSTFIINLEQNGKDVVLLATHANIPEKHFAGINKGWHDYYWKPWKQFLSGEKITHPGM